MATAELARRAVACKGWRWIPGMRLFGRYHHPARATVASVGDSTLILADGGHDSRGRADRVDTHGLEADWLPDLEDPATLGCLLALVREAWGDPLAWTIADDCEGVIVWSCGVGNNGGKASVFDSGKAGEGRCFSGAGEAEALVAALEAAGKAGE